MLCKLLWTEFHYKHIYLRRSRSSKFRIGLGGQLPRKTRRAVESVDSMAGAWLVLILEKKAILIVLFQAKLNSQSNPV